MSEEGFAHPLPPNVICLNPGPNDANILVLTNLGFVVCLFMSCYLIKNLISSIRYLSLESEAKFDTRVKAEPNFVSSVIY